MAIKISDIALYCGVSEGTVDRALHNRPGINPETRQRILEAAEELHYTPNQIAKSLATGSTKTIGVICFDLSNYFFASLVEILEREAGAHHYFISLILTHGQVEKEKEAIRYFTQRHVDGILLFPVGQGVRYTKQLLALDIPIVTVYNRLPPFSHVGVDGRRSMEDAVCFLYEKGYKNIHFLTAHYTDKLLRGDNVYTLEERLAGYRQGLSRCGLPLGTVIEGRDAQVLLKLADHAPNERTALLCVSDTMALWALEVCQNSGIRIPTDLGLMGYDNAEVLRYIRPKLSSISYDIEQLGKSLIDELLRQIRKENPIPETLLGYSFVEGETL